MTQHRWVFPVLDAAPYDGDSVYLLLDTGFSSRRYDLCRIMGVDAPEIRTEAGRLVKKLVAKWVERRGPLMFLCHKHRDKYGRPLGSLYPEANNEASLSNFLINSQTAKEYQGGRRSWDHNELQAVVDKCRELLSGGD